MTHLPVWDLYTFERFFSVQINPVFHLMFFRNKMQNNLNLIFGFGNSILVLSFLIVAFLKEMLLWLVWGLVLYRACSYILKHIYFILILLSFVVFPPKGWNKDFIVFYFLCFSKTSMSFVFMLFKVFNVICFYAFQRLQCLLFLCFTRRQCLLFYALHDFNVNVLYFYAL